VVLHWCVCHVAHKVPGWCFCDSLSRRQQRAFLSEKENLRRKEEEERNQRRRDAKEACRRLASDSAGHDAYLRLLKGKGKRKRIVLRAAAPLGPRTPNPNALAPELAPDLSLVAFSSLLPKPEAKRQKADPLLARSTSGGQSQARRRLEADFIESAKREKKEDGAVAGRLEAGGGGSKGKGKAYRRMKRKYQMPWHSWFCTGCGKKLPNGHMNCVGEVLRQFDISAKYGPCLGMTRYERWLRAFDLGLDPPAAVLDILNRSQNLTFLNKCMWEHQV